MRKAIAAKKKEVLILKELIMAKEGLKKWFSRNKGKGWIDCKTGKPCGRKSAKGGSKRPYPACRPTKAQCNSAKK